MDFPFLADTFLRLCGGIPLTLLLALISCAIGAVLALCLAAMRLSKVRPLAYLAHAYVFVYRGTPLLVQIFLVYYGFGQFPLVRHSFLWPILREPFWCAIIALSMNTGAYASEIIRGGILSVPHGQIEAARACGMSRLTQFRRIVMPLAIRQALPAYGTEIILMVKATSLASIITLMEITGIAAEIISGTYRVIEVFIIAGALYLAINFVLTRIVKATERWLTPYERGRPTLPLAASVNAGEIA